jgi:hypothetical protein
MTPVTPEQFAKQMREIRVMCRHDPDKMFILSIALLAKLLFDLGYTEGLIELVENAPAAHPAHS